VGDSVGLHPVWLLLALSVFGALFGFIGLLVAVPLAAALGVVVRFLAEQYKGSRLYLGLLGRGEDE
jgi:predicted PurR-regulated permease PerM